MLTRQRVLNDAIAFVTASLHAHGGLVATTSCPTGINAPPRAVDGEHDSQIAAFSTITLWIIRRRGETQQGMAQAKSEERADDHGAVWCPDPSQQERYRGRIRAPAHHEPGYYVTLQSAKVLSLRPP